ncbi:hypothetical protein IPF86_02775 [Candidatus Nomurabacteria bacterium]|nr:MAG: hypothetical protein IPF86_02775 [Candidatus Nomurabacteria bacterium]
MTEKMNIHSDQESSQEDFTTFLDSLNLGIRANNYARNLIPHVKTKQEFLDLSFSDLLKLGGTNKPGLTALLNELREKGIQANSL